MREIAFSLISSKRSTTDSHQALRYLLENENDRILEFKFERISLPVVLNRLNRAKFSTE